MTDIQKATIQTWLNWKNWYYLIEAHELSDREREIFGRISGNDVVCNTYEQDKTGSKRSAIEDKNSFYHKTHSIGAQGILSLQAVLKTGTKEEILADMRKSLGTWLEYIVEEHGQQFIDDNSEVFTWNGK